MPTLWLLSVRVLCTHKGEKSTRGPKIKSPHLQHARTGLSTPTLHALKPVKISGESLAGNHSSTCTMAAFAGVAQQPPTLVTFKAGKLEAKQAATGTKFVITADKRRGQVSKQGSGCCAVDCVVCVSYVLLGCVCVLFIRAVSGPFSASQADLAATFMPWIVCCNTPGDDRA
jgi:hypothetical protein